MSAVISGVGLWTPAHTVTNDELVASYNAYADQYNARYDSEIAAGTRTAKPHSSSEFIEKASGIKSRFAYVKDGILDLDAMAPRIPPRRDDELSHQAEIALNAARPALAAANKSGPDVDLVIVACAYTERAYPAIAIEVQDALGAVGSAFDMLVACSSATFAIQRARDAVLAGSARCVLVVNPELTSPQVNYCDRDSHFIFGDVATATVIEHEDTCTSRHSFRILGSRAVTSFSNNIRSNFGYLARAEGGDPFSDARLFHQNGRSVFKEVCPLAAAHLESQVTAHGIPVAAVRRWWLHQANINMNQLIVRRLLGRDATSDEAPTELDTYANTASAGSIIAFARHHEDLTAGDYGVICSFGAGYSIGSLLVQKR
jgi:beta-ketodecanoyl-[acyl-carrier-protein] synthase